MKTKFNGILTLLLALIVQISFAQDKTISGTVSDESGPLPGVTVLKKGTTQGTETDFDGNYSIKAKTGDVLVFSFVGMRSSQKTVNQSNTINLMLESDNLLDEIVVVAFGTQKKEEIAGSVSTLKTEELGQIQASNIAQGLAGKVSGVQIINQNGQPGEAPTIRFRGIGSINSSSEPLYVVDGVVFNGNITSISNQDIESMSFLKDASANALYGSRGANGVIIITTKKGKKGALEVTLDTKVGINSRAVPEYDLIKTPKNYYEAWFSAWKEALIKGGATPQNAANAAATGLISGGDYSLNYNSFDVPSDQVIDPATGKLNPSANLLYFDDWNDAAFRSGIRTENYLSLSARGENSSNFFSIGQLKDEGFAINSGFERISARFSTDYTPAEWLKIGGNINYANTTQDSPIQGLGSGTLSNLFGWVRNVAPIYPIFGRNADGSIIRDLNGNPVYDFGSATDGVPGIRPSFVSETNAIATTKLGINENLYDNIASRAYATFSFFNDFQFTYNFSADITLGNFTSYDTPVGGSAQSVNGRVTTRSSRGLTTNHQQLLNWNKDFGRHSLAVLLGHESYEYNFRLFGGQKAQTVIDQLPVLDNAVAVEELFGYQKFYNVEGYFSRLNYNYDDKYFFNASFRRDGSSVFAPDNRWGNFYGLGFAWSAHKENFLNDVSWLNLFRVKASFGQQGNDALLYEDNRRRTPGDRDNRNYYSYEDQFDIVNAGGDVPGITFFQLGNKELKWETSTNINAGIELGLFNNRLSVNAEYFKREVKDLLFFNPIATSEGVGSKPENIGDMENNGIEIEISGDIIKTDNFTWSMSLNGTHYKNEITRLPDEFIRETGLRALEVGKSRYDYYTREWAGVDATNGDATWTQYFDDTNANGTLDTGENNISDLSQFVNSNPDATIGKTTTNNASSATQFFVGKSAIPDIYGGFSSRFSYKGLDLNLGFSYQIGGYGFDGVYQGLLSASSPGSNMHIDVLSKTWTSENTTASLPRVDTENTTQNSNSTLFLVDASFLSLNDVTLGYTFGDDVLNTLGLSYLRFYASANNVKLWTNARKGYDPRLSITGLTTNEYSIVSSASLGLTLKF